MKQIKAAGIQVVGVSYDPVATLKKFAEQGHIRFPLLSDKDSKIIDAYKVRNTSVRKGSRQDGIPHPITIIVDQHGVVRAKLPGTVARRHSTADLLKAANQLGQQ